MKQDYLASRIEKRANGEADVVVFCHEGSNSLDEFRHPRSEGVSISNLQHLFIECHKCF